MLEELLSDLKMFGALECYQDNDFSKINFTTGLTKMLKAEKSRRSANALKRRLSYAKFPYVREWEQIDKKINPSIPFARIRKLSDGKFIHEKKNLCLTGAPGLGKTHSLVAIGRDLSRLGLRVRFFTACDLVNQLEEAKNNLELTKFMNKIMKPHFLIIDELGFVPFTDNGARLLFDVFSKRYETGSIAVSTNLAFNKWPEIFGSVELTTALVDRFTHNCEIFTFKGDSVRLSESKLNSEKK